MKSAMMFYEALCAGQNRGLRDLAKRVPKSRYLSRKEMYEIVPDLDSDEITGGVSFYESHMHSSERMTLGFVETACQYGAVVANYMQVEEFLGAGDGRVTGVRVQDKLKDAVLDVHASLVINASGPWIPMLNKKARSGSQIEGIVNAFSKGAHIVTRPLIQGHAVVLPTRKKNQAIINRGGRHVFIIPWRDCSLIGTTYGPYQGDIDDVRVSESDIEEMIADINSAFEHDVLHRNDVQHAYAGLYPLTDDLINPNVYQGTGAYEIIDHATTDGLDGLISVFGAKYTTARRVSEKALDMIVPRFNKALDRCRTRETRLASGDIDDIQEFRANKKKQYGAILAETIIDNLVTNYGTKIDKILELIACDNSLRQELVPEGKILAAEVVYAVRDEMAFHLEDVVFRRTGLGTLGHPGEDALKLCADLMSKELDWSEDITARELGHTVRAFVANP
jgi:glycerol-3-phosphate dehydrogenase